MRDQRFVAAHRGGPLDQHRHRLLAIWAADCAEHVLPLFTQHRPHDDRPAQAIETARAWSRGEISVGEARTAALATHAAAREATNDAAVAVARAAGHAAGVAHMADHAKGAASYAIKAVQTVDKADNTAADAEQSWQRAQLPAEVRSLISTGG